jgi:hypothetical protein
VQGSTVSPIRQKFALLISNGNFADSKSARFQRLSASIDRFFQVVGRDSVVGSAAKRPSASTALAVSSIPWSFDNAFALDLIPERKQGWLIPVMDGPWYEVSEHGKRAGISTSGPTTRP